MPSELIAEIQYNVYWLKALKTIKVEASQSLARQTGADKGSGGITPLRKSSSPVLRSLRGNLAPLLARSGYGAAIGSVALGPQFGAGAGMVAGAALGGVMHFQFGGQSARRSKAKQATVQRLIDTHLFTYAATWLRLTSVTNPLSSDHLAQIIQGTEPLLLQSAENLTRQINDAFHRNEPGFKAAKGQGFTEALHLIENPDQLIDRLPAPASDLFNPRSRGDSSRSRGIDFF